MGRQSAIKRARRLERARREATDPLANASRYADPTTVLGGPITPSALVERVRTFNWRDSFVYLAQLATEVANAPDGPRCRAMQARVRDRVRELTGSNPAAIAQARRWANSDDEAVIVHEEAIDFLQHVVLLHGSEEGDCPHERELVLWLIGAGQFLGQWEDESSCSEDERLIAEVARVARFNNQEDPVHLLVRVYELFRTPPFQGPLANQDTWRAVQQAAFGMDFDQHFRTRVAPLYAQSFRWGIDDGVPPVLAPRQWVSALGARGDSIVSWIDEITRTRDEINLVTRRRMHADGLLPRAPTALLHNPVVCLSEDRVGISSPWRLLAMMRMGIWARYLAATRQVLGTNASWFPAFGYMFEQWLRKVAEFAAETPEFSGELILPTHPGSADEVDDVVVIEGSTTFLFSAKARVVEEPVARHARSVRAVMDWYHAYFFDEANDDFRGGAVRQFDRRIQRIRSGTYPGFPANNRVVPVLVTYDSLSGDTLLYDWLHVTGCALGLMQQGNVAPLTVMRVDDFERLMSRASRGLSMRAFFGDRERDWRLRAVRHQLGAYQASDRLPQIDAAYWQLMNAISVELGGAALRRES